MKDLIVFAMKEEAQDLFEKNGIPVLYTGIGKVNAAHRFAWELSRLVARGEKPRVVINFGTAGSPKFPTHTLVECTRFVQRDMDVSPLGFAPGTTPFETDPAVIVVPKRFTNLLTGVCGTGDNFETAKPKVACDVVDMEAYALAKICMREQIPFISLKYISDGSDHNAHNDWTENVVKAAASFLAIMKELKALQL
jgi:adenosylhomocysteine nucleosidase